VGFLNFEMKVVDISEETPGRFRRAPFEERPGRRRKR
jgi:hypothetical protein